MNEKILVPVLGESITEATVSKWLKNEGDSVEADEPLVELETDKVNLEVPSPVSGVLIRTPDTGEGTSKFTLSVSSSTSGSSASTESPSFFNHLETVASVILSPRTGTNIFSFINIYSKTFFIISCC